MSLRNNSSLDLKLHSDRLPILCYVTDCRSLKVAPHDNPLETLLAKIETAAISGLDWVQLREKDLSGKDCASLSREALLRVSRQVPANQAATKIIINDRLDVALATQASGVHLGENSFPVEAAKRLLLASGKEPSRSANFLVGVSCHSLEAAQSAASAGADYIFFGPIFATPSKAAVGSPQGLDRLSEVCRSVNIPVLAIGGISLANIPSCFSAGASGIAAIRLFQDATNLAETVGSIRRNYRRD